MRDNEDSAEEAPQHFQEPEEDTFQNRGGFNDDGRSGAMVEEAKRLMEDDDEEPAQKAAGEEEPSGPKIKMGKIGKKSKKPTGAAAGGQSENYTKKLAAASLDAPSRGGAFSESDIEFMKKAI